MYDMSALYQAQSVQDAIRLRLEHPEAQIIAGGSDVLVQMREGKRAGAELISIYGLDELRGIVTHGKDIIAGIQEREIERTGITSLKISYNNVFGYYLEVRNTHKDKVPPEWIRKQTLV